MHRPSKTSIDGSEYSASRSSSQSKVWCGCIARVYFVASTLSCLILTQRPYAIFVLLLIFVTCSFWTTGSQGSMNKREIRFVYFEFEDILECWVVMLLLSSMQL